MINNKFDAMIAKLITLCFGILKINTSKTRIDTYVQFIKFCIVGVSNTLLSYAIYVLVVWSLRNAHFPWDYMVGNVVAFVLSVLWSFFWNNRYVFTDDSGGHRNIWKALLKTYMSYAFTGLILGNIEGYIFIDVCGISKYVAPFVGLVVNVPINFVMNKVWAFRSDIKNK